MIKTARSGFTLVELLVVITIIAILSTVGLTIYSGVSGRARDSQRLDDARKIITALEQFKSGVGKYPGASCNWCQSNGGPNWILELDTTNFRNNAIPNDPTPKNSPELWYYYTSDGNDYCLQISQEQNASGHPYIKSNLGNPPGFWNGSWKLRFGPQGALAGLCNSR